MRIVQDVGAAGDGQGGAPAAAGGVIVPDQVGDGWLSSAQPLWMVAVGRDVLPIVSTMPVNMVKVLV